MRGLFLASCLLTTALLLFACAQNVTPILHESVTDVTTISPFSTVPEAPTTITTSGNSSPIALETSQSVQLTTTISQTPLKEQVPTSATTITTTPKTTSKTTSTLTSSPPTVSLPPLDARMKGFCFSDYNSTGKERLPQYGGPIFYAQWADQTLKEIADAGTNWIIVTVNIEQETIQSTKITTNPFNTASDDALRHVVEFAHGLGMRVALNLTMKLSQDPSHYPQQIGTMFGNDLQWQEWFASYREMIIHYAALSQDSGVDLFFIGQELAGTVHREDDWRNIAQEVRKVFKNPIAYEATVTPPNQTTGEHLQVKWWDAVDYIGVLGYFQLTQITNPTVEQLKSAWTGWVSQLETLSQKFQRPIIISEIGYLSADGTNMIPSMTGFHKRFGDGTLDLQEQADCYQAALEVFWDKPWVKGIFWWHYLANPIW